MSYARQSLKQRLMILLVALLAAAGCMLPLSSNASLSRDLGMRHRAGIGMSEQSDAVVIIVSEETGISVAEIYGVVTFYSFFSLSPKGKYVIGCCLGTACYVKGAQQVIDKFSEILKIAPGETTEDGLFTNLCLQINPFCCKQDDKPGYVVGRSSIYCGCCQPPLATYLKAGRADLSLSIWSCFGWGLHGSARYRTDGSLLSCLSTLTKSNLLRK